MLCFFTIFDFHIHGIFTGLFQLGLLVIHSPEFFSFLGVERGQIHFIAAQCFER